MEKGFAVIAACMLIAFGALAQDQTPRADQRQANQRLRIRQGFAQGDLNRREMARLMAAQRMIRRGECFAKADGRVTRYERIRLHRMQQRASRHIYRERHDRQSQLH